MIRVNVHLDPSWLERLDEIKEGLCEFGGKAWWAGRLTRADLIRFAVARVFGFKYPYVHIREEMLSAELKKLLKKSSTKEGV